MFVQENSDDRSNKIKSNCENDHGCVGLIDVWLIIGAGGLLLGDLVMSEPRAWD